MFYHSKHDNATSNVLAWSTHSANVEFAAEEEGAGDADEPPDQRPHPTQTDSDFKRTAIRRGSEQHSSLLTRALQSHPDDAPVDRQATLATIGRRRSMTSNISIASTAELTSDTGVTTPARTNSPSPRLPQLGFVPIANDKHNANRVQIVGSVPKGSLTSQHLKEHLERAEPCKDPAVQALEKKRCISFACGAKPVKNVSTVMPPPPKPEIAVAKPPQDAPRRPCIKFACTTRPTPSATQKPEQTHQAPKAAPRESRLSVKDVTPAAARKHRSPAPAMSGRSSTVRKSSQSPVAVRSKKYITANSRDLQGEVCRFHEFASDEQKEDDWIREEKSEVRHKLTLDDILVKENAIRKLAKEAEEEEEAEQEAQKERDEDEDDEEDEDDDDDADTAELDELEEEDTLEDDQSGYGSDDDASDGYNTDTEIGFASSDDEDEDDLVLWTTRRVGASGLSDATPVVHPSSWDAAIHSDSSANSAERRGRHNKTRHLDISQRALRLEAPELPDSTDFVCGTLDEDRPLEEAFMSRLAAKKREKLHVIPQDIDPSFPTSEPEDEEDEEDEYKPRQASDEHVWLHGELEDMDDDEDGNERRKKVVSPKRHHSPAPKRLHSPPPKRLHSPPPPKNRGRSPRRLFDRQSPRRVCSPAPHQLITSPPASLVHTGEGVAFKSLAFRPGLTQAKSMPKRPAVLHYMKAGRRPRANTATKDQHVRGAIDIVKGLEQKRQRRKEKFYQKYCHRARKGQHQERKPQPGQGAERMRELGLLMAGKVGQGNYVLSV